MFLYPEVFRSHKDSLPWLEGRTIFVTLHGSWAYGLNTPGSDIDLKGIAIPPKPYFLGFSKKFEQAESKDPDAVIYDIRKFFELATNCNPNIIEVLWTDPADHLVTTPLSDRLLQHRSAFLSKRAKFSFSGYAIAQLKRIKTHRKWLLSPPKAPPNRLDFNLPEHESVLNPTERGAIQKLVDDGISIPHAAMQVFHQELAYRNAQRHWEQYQNWRASRNPARAAMEAESGFDRKHATHLVRLMRMAKEILTEGIVHVKRQDREELLAIRSGAWSYEKLMGWAEEMDRELDELYEKSTLQHSPPREELDQLCQEIVEGSL